MKLLGITIALLIVVTSGKQVHGYGKEIGQFVGAVVSGLKVLYPENRWAKYGQVISPLIVATDNLYGIFYKNFQVPESSPFPNEVKSKTTVSEEIKHVDSEPNDTNTNMEMERTGKAETKANANKMLALDAFSERCDRDAFLRECPTSNPPNPSICSLKTLSFQCSSLNPDRLLIANTEWDDSNRASQMCHHELSRNQIDYPLPTAAGLNITFVDHILREKVNDNVYLRALVDIGIGMNALHRSLVNLVLDSGDKGSRYDKDKTAGIITKLIADLRVVYGTSILLPTFEWSSSHFLQKYASLNTAWNMKEFVNDFLTEMYNPAKCGNW